LITERDISEKTHLIFKHTEAEKNMAHLGVLCDRYRKYMWGNEITNERSR
jgi:hypothetical protein